MDAASRYWVAGPDGKPYGPYDIPTLQGFVREGRVTVATQLCAEGSQNWVPASAVAGVIAATPAAAPRAAEAIPLADEVAPGAAAAATGIRYWIAGPDGKPYGPYDMPTLRGYVGEGRVLASTQLCAENAQTWAPASTIPGLGPFNTMTAGVRYDGAGADWTPASYVGPILATICCCLIGGIVSIVYTAQANTKAAGGDFQGAEQSKATAKQWLIASVIIGVVVNVLVLIVQIVAVAGSQSGYP